MPPSGKCGKIKALTSRIRPKNSYFSCKYVVLPTYYINSLEGRKEPNNTQFSPPPSTHLFQFSIIFLFGTRDPERDKGTIEMISGSVPAPASYSIFLHLELLEWKGISLLWFWEAGRPLKKGLTFEELPFMIFSSIRFLTHPIISSPPNYLKSLLTHLNIHFSDYTSCRRVSVHSFQYMCIPSIAHLLQ